LSASNDIDDVFKSYQASDYENVIRKGLEILADKKTSDDPVRLYSILADSYYRLFNNIPDHSLYYWGLYLSTCKKDDLPEGITKCYDQWGDNRPKEMIQILNLYLPKLRDAGAPVEKFIYFLGVLYSKTGKSKAANDMFKEIIKYYQDEDIKEKAKDFLLNNLIGDKRSDDALDMLMKMDQTPKNLLKIADIYEEKFDFYNARKSLSEAIKLDDANIGMKRRLLDIDLKLGDYDGCLNTIDKLKTMDIPESEKADLLLKEAKIWVVNKQRFLIDDTGKYIKTFDNLNKAVKIYNSVMSEYSDDNVISTRAKLGLAKAYLGLYNNNKAVEVLNSIIKNDTDSIAAIEAKKILDQVGK